MAELLLAELDSRRFGKRIYRGTIDRLGEIHAARIDDAEAIFVRVPTRALDVVQALEALGFYLCDTLIYYEGKIGLEENPGRSGWAEIRDAGPQDNEDLASLTRASFGHFSGHYHSDPELDPRAATEGYVEWCLSSVENDDWVLLAELEGRLVGFLTAGRVEERVGEIFLNGVHPDFQRRGVYAALFSAARRRLSAAGLATIRISTQVGNLGPQKVWVRNGLEPVRAFYTLHWWQELRSQRSREG